MSPEDYRIWLSLGRALERQESLAEAQAALERAVRLAPHHFDPHWALGNLLLRAGEREAAFAEFRQALASRPSALPLIFNYAWNAYHGDGRAVRQAIAPPVESRAQLASLLISRHEVDEALALWGETGQPTAAEARLLIDALIGIQRFGAAYGLWRSALAGGGPATDDGSLLVNGSFEREIRLNDATPFATWRIAPGAGFTASRDSQAHRAGDYSLRLNFDAPDHAELNLASQTVAVKPAVGYRLSFAARTEALQSSSTPLVEVYDAASMAQLHARSEPLKAGNNDWRDYVLEFTTSPATEVVTVRIRRPSCASPPCPLSGRVWFDDFKLSAR
jgi:hypothetical protein